jgi:hypothetical protein
MALKTKVKKNKTKYQIPKKMPSSIYFAVACRIVSGANSKSSSFQSLIKMMMLNRPKARPGVSHFLALANDSACGHDWKTVVFLGLISRERSRRACQTEIHESKL